MKNTKNKILVQREKYVKNEKEFYAYFVKGLIKGKEVKANIVPSDFGGYTLLDLIFTDNDNAELLATPFEFKEEATGNIINGVSYFVNLVDTDGEVIECKVKPAKSSDKSIIKLLMK